jgi:hypothetical protein
VFEDAGDFLGGNGGEFTERQSEGWGGFGEHAASSESANGHGHGQFESQSHPTTKSPFLHGDDEISLPGGGYASPTGQRPSLPEMTPPPPSPGRTDTGTSSEDMPGRSFRCIHTPHPHIRHTCLSSDRDGNRTPPPQ